MTLASLAQKYWLKPSALGGGNQSFTNWQIPPSLETTEAGTFKIENQDQNTISIVGTGNEVVTGNDTIKVQITVPSPPADYVVTIIN